MKLVKGMRSKIDTYYDVNSMITIELNCKGSAVYDYCCFGVDEQNQLSDEGYMVFYNQTSSSKNEIKYGKEGGKGRFAVELSKLPHHINKLVFTVSIDGSETMSEIVSFNAEVKQIGAETLNLELYGQDFKDEKAIIVLEIYRRENWRIATVANGFNGGLSALLKYYGGIEEVQSDSENGKVNDMSQQGIERKEYNEKSLVKDGNRRQIQKHEVFNSRGKGENSTKIFFKYNPYTVETFISIDGREVEAPNKLYDLKMERMQVWIEDLLPILVETCNDDSFQIDFYGLRHDYDDLALTVSEYCEKNSNVEVILDYTEAMGNEDRLSELKELFEDMQKNCPFEDLRTKQIQDNFYNAISSQFEVSVIATMSSGKSTLINSLLGKELMPSKNEACTATIAKIKDTNCGSGFKAVYMDRDNNVLGKFENLTLDEMETMNENPQTAYIDMEGNIPHIDSSGIRLVLVDTPGPNNSRTEEHKNHTYKVIKEKTKPMVLYVLNATQLQTNDDFQLLSTVAEAMKVGGKQSKDRFIFAVNKIDQFDPDKESVAGALDHVREYLKKFDIENPNIFPTSAETAKVIRMYQNGQRLTKNQTKTLENSISFLEEKQLHLSEQASLSRHNLQIVKQKIDDAKKCGNQYEEIMMYTGVPAIELAINEYLQKYAYTTKIKSAVDTFKKKVEEKDMHSKMLTAIQDDEDARNEIHRQLDNIKRILEDGSEAQKFKERITSLDMMKDAKKRIRNLRAKISKELKPSNDRGAMTTLEVQQLMMKLNTTVQHLQCDVKTELDNIINDVIIDNAKSIMNDYKEHLHELIQSGVMANNEYSCDVNSNGIDFLEMDIPDAQEIINSYKYDEKYDTGEEEWVENTNKKWYKPWTWFQESGHYRTVYANREMVDYTTVENEYLAPILSSFNENIENAQQFAQDEAERFKCFFLKELSVLEDALKVKVQENEKLTQDQNSINLKIAEEKEKVKWLEKFLNKLDSILEI